MAYIDGAAAPQQWATLEDLQKMFGGIVPEPPTPAGLPQTAPSGVEAPTVGTNVPLPMPRPRAPAQVPTENTAAGLVEQGRQALREGGSLLPEGWRDTIYDTLRGGLAVDPTAGKLTNFLSGLLGAIESRQSREQAEQDRTREEEERARAEEDRAFDREGALLDRRQTEAEIARTNRQDQPTPPGGMTTEQRIRLAEAETKHMVDWTTARFGIAGIGGLDDAARTAAQAEIDAERQRFRQEILGTQGGGAAAPGAGGISEGATATGPNGERIVLRGGVWVDMATGQPFAGQ